MSKVENLINICENTIKSRYCSIFWTFNLNFDNVNQLIKEEFNGEQCSNSELDQFIDICNNRIDMFNAFLKDISMMLGFDFIALSIIVSIMTSGSPSQKLSDLLFLNNGDFVLSLISWSLIFIAIFLFVSLTICRKLLYLWTIFKERAILSKVYS